MAFDPNAYLKMTATTVPSEPEPFDPDKYLEITTPETVRIPDALPETAPSFQTEPTPDIIPDPASELPVFSSSNDYVSSSAKPEPGISSSSDYIPSKDPPISDVALPPRGSGTPVDVDPSTKIANKIEQKADDPESIIHQTINAYKQGDKESIINEMYNDVITGEKSLEEAKAFEKEFNKISGDPVKVKGFLKKGFLGAVGMGPMLLKGIKAGQEGGITGGIAGAAASAVGGVTVLPGAAIGYGLGSSAKSTEYWRRQGASEAYRGMIDKGVNHETASALSQMVGIPYAFLERLQVLKFIPKKLQRNLTNGVIKQITKWGVKAGTDIGEETFVEGLQKVTTSSAEEIGQYIDGLKDVGSDVKGSLKKVLSDGATEMKEVLPTMVFMLGPKISTSAVSTAENIKGTLQLKKSVQEFNDNIKGSKATITPTGVDVEETTPTPTDVVDETVTQDAVTPEAEPTVSTDKASLSDIGLQDPADFWKFEADVQADIRNRLTPEALAQIDAVKPEAVTPETTTEDVVAPISEEVEAEIADVAVDETTPTDVVPTKKLTYQDIGLKTPEDFWKFDSRTQEDAMATLDDESVKAVQAVKPTEDITETEVELPPVYKGEAKKFDDKEIDRVTQIPMSNVIRKKIDEAKKDNSKLILFFDIDDFKSINDTYGHDKGDEILLSVGKKVTQHFGDIDYGRAGGEEFAVILDNNEQAGGRAKDFIEDFSSDIKVDGQPVTISGGLSTGVKADGGDARKLYPDILSYEAKTSGKNQIVFDKDGEIIYIKGKDIGGRDYVKKFNLRELEKRQRELLKESDLSTSERKSIEGALQVISERSSRYDRGATSETAKEDVKSPVPKKPKPKKLTKKQKAKQLRSEAFAGAQAIRAQEKADLEQVSELAGVLKLGNPKELLEKNPDLVRYISENQRDARLRQLFDLQPNETFNDDFEVVDKSTGSLTRLGADKILEAEGIIDSKEKERILAEVADFISTGKKPTPMKEAKEQARKEIEDAAGFEKFTRDEEAKKKKEAKAKKKPPKELPFSKGKVSEKVVDKKTVVSVGNKVFNAFMPNYDGKVSVVVKPIGRGNEAMIQTSKGGKKAVLTVSPNIDPKRLERVIIHEIVVHFGVKSILDSNPKVENTIQQLYTKDQNSDITKDLKKLYRKHFNEVSSKYGDNVAEEMLFHEWVAAQVDRYTDGKVRGKDRLTATRVYEAIRKLVEKLIKEFKIATGRSPKDIQDTVDLAMKVLLDALKKSKGKIGVKQAEKLYSRVESAEGKVGGIAGRGLGIAPEMKGTSRLYSKIEVPTFYSPIAKAIDNSKQNKAPGSQWLAMIKKQPGIKQAEMDWLGLEEFLADKKSVTKEELQEFIAQNSVEIEETELDPLAISSFKSRHETWVLPGGQNYREMLFQMPPTPMSFEEFQSASERAGVKDKEVLKQRYQEYLGDIGKDYSRTDSYKTSHFDQPNIFAHTRVNDRVTPDGKKVLFIEEIQSDWTKEARAKGVIPKNYDKLNNRRKELEDKGLLLKKEGKEASDSDKQEWTDIMNKIRPEKMGRTPDMPFFKNWQEVVLKRMLRYAADNNYDEVSWITGEQTADRYDLSKQVDEIRASKREGTDKYRVFAIKNGEETGLGVHEASKLPSVVGKDLAKRIIEEDGGTFKGDNLKVGGEWASNLYDKMIPQFLNKYVKKWGAKVGETEISGNKQQSLPITDKMKEAVMFDGQPMFSKVPTSAVEEGFTVPAETRRDIFVRKIQDKYKRLKTIQESILKAGGTIDEEADAYLTEELMHGKTEEALNSFEDSKVKPLLKDMTKNNITVDELGLYLYAKHAKERNAHIWRINSEFKKEKIAGSGMTDAKADEILKSFKDDGNVDKFEALAKQIYNISKSNREKLLKEGLINEATKKGWEKFEYYVPLKGFLENPEKMEVSSMSPHIGRGYDIRGKESKRAAGRKSMAADIVSNVISQSEEAIVRAEKNKIGLSLLKLVRENPNKDLWEINKATRRPAFNKKTGEVSYNLDPMYKLSDEVLSVKENGEEIYITIHDKALVDNLKNIGADKMNKAVQALGTLNRYIAMINTTMNPEFMLGNFSRDIQTAMINLSAEDSAKLAGKVLKDTPKAMRGAWQGIRGKNGKAWGKWYQRFEKAGGKVGFFGLESIEQKQKKIIKSINAMKPGAKGKTIRAFNAVKDLMMDVNGAVENSVRLSLFKNLVESGMSEKMAASKAKNLTVNFNRKGEIGGMLNSLYVFSNASIQGVARLFKVMKSKRMKKIASGIAVGSFMWAQLGRSIGGDDEDGENFYDKIDDHIKKSNLIIMKPTGKGDYIKIPLPYGYNIFYALGQALDEVLHNKNPMKAAANLVGTVLDSFNPLGGSSSLIQTLSPTALDPIVDLGLNENFFGGPLWPEQPAFGVKKPRSQLKFKSVGKISSSATEALNELTGGSKFKSGLLDVNPEALDHIFEFLTGGTGKFINNTVTTIAGTYKGMKEGKSFIESAKDVPIGKVPFARRFFADKSEYVDSKKFYDRAEQLKQVFDEYKALAKEDRKEAIAFRKEHADEFKLKGQLKLAETRIRFKRKNIRRFEKLEKDEQVKEKKDLINDIMMGFNKRWNQTVKD